jgi:hypothetical protein
MRLLVATLTLALTITGAYAQNAGGPGMGGGGGHRGHQQSSDKTGAQKPKVDEQAYRNALKSVPDKPYDPWQGTR